MVIIYFFVVVKYKATTECTAQVQRINGPVIVISTLAEGTTVLMPEE
mgnify:CR=1 FL=1